MVHPPTRKGFFLRATAASAAVQLFAAGAAFAAGEGEAPIKVIPDASVFIQIINFLLLIWLLNILLYRPIRNVLLRRKERVDKLEETIQANRLEAEKKDEAFAEGVKNARLRGIRERDALVEAAGAEEKEKIDEINRRAQKELAAVRERIAKETSSAREQLMAEVKEYAAKIGEKILGRTV
jgi:F-type H+-transporting ATPase subunit b